MDGDQASDARSEVDAAMRRLWGLEAKPRRGPKPALSVQVIVDAALELADTKGLAGVSMASVGAALGCSSMALYSHLASKDELITLLVDRVAADEPAILERLGWREGSGRGGRRSRSTACSRTRGCSTCPSSRHRWGPTGHDGSTKASL